MNPPLLPSVHNVLRDHPPWTPTCPPIQRSGPSHSPRASPLSPQGLLPRRAPESPCHQPQPKARSLRSLPNMTTAKERLEGLMLAKRSVSDLSFDATSARRVTFEEPVEKTSVASGSG
ncbi:hypothetical protein QJS04_geneDACA016809 [Acorus gramineus]|uniref:Uncharacterized protein n=1 Tax=Acorus gramineus TaxID=55184 RepID=A0AAV8ZYH2_ACOGR|nr:hypothetical protein QJS04_geneDACA016809 [Acorus gramineus]